MAEFFDQLVTFFEHLVLTIGYPGIFAVMFAENLIPPIPTDPLLPFAGILVADDEMNFFIVWITAVTGAISGTLVLYSIGAWADEHVIRRLVTRYGRYVAVTNEGLDRAFKEFDRHGAWFILIGRSIPIVRSAVTLAAGMSRMPLPKFIILSTINSALVTGFWILAGVFLGENWNEVWDRLNTEHIILIGLILVTIYLVFRVFRRRTQEDPQTITSIEQDRVAVDSDTP